MLRGFRRTTLATTFLALVALCPWELLSRHYPTRHACQGLALMLILTVAAPALIIALHSALVANGVRVVDELFGLTPASPWHAAQRAELVFDVGPGDMARVKMAREEEAAHPYRRRADAAAKTLGCCGDAERACSMLSSLSAGAAAVAAIALLHAAKLGLG